MIRGDEKYSLAVKRYFGARGYLSIVLVLLAVLPLSCFDLARADGITGQPGNVEGRSIPSASQSVPLINTPESKATVAVPPDVQSKYPDFIRMITSSALMDDEEKQYWVDVLPEMTAEQLGKLAALLGIERDKTDALDEKYRHELSELNKQVR